MLNYLIQISGELRSLFIISNAFSIILVALWSVSAAAFGILISLNENKKSFECILKDEDILLTSCHESLVIKTYFYNIIYEDHYRPKNTVIRMNFIYLSNKTITADKKIYN